jgi:hypothetical protein
MTMTESITKRAVSDYELSSKLFKMLISSGYDARILSDDDEGRSHKISFSGPNDDCGQIYTKDGRIFYISSELGD